MWKKLLKNCSTLKPAEKAQASLTKDVNEETKRAIHIYLPEDFPQDVCPIKITLIIDGEESQTINNDLQLVLEVNA